MSYRQKRDLYWDAIDGIQAANMALEALALDYKDDVCLLYTSPSPRDGLLSRMPSSA